MSDKPLPKPSDLMSKLPSLSNTLQNNKVNQQLPPADGSNAPLPSSSSLLSNLPKPPSVSTPNSALPSARALGITFPWHEERYRQNLSSYKKETKSSVLPPMQTPSSLPSQNSTFQQLPPSMQNSSALNPLNHQPKTFQNTPLQGLRTNNLGKRYLEEQQVILFHSVCS
eukprot:NODE_229_length_12207_cov_1.116700.p10 type:complete len:169 gc:universal NODE_229_length_12207_cov_1.116700:8760-9266(+)